MSTPAVLVGSPHVPIPDDVGRSLGRLTSTERDRLLAWLREVVDEIARQAAAEGARLARDSGTADLAAGTPERWT